MAPRTRTLGAAGILAETLNALAPSADALSATLSQWSNGLDPDNPHALVFAAGEPVSPGPATRQAVDELEAKLQAIPATAAAIRRALAPEPRNGPSVTPDTPLPGLAAGDLDKMRAWAMPRPIQVTGCGRCNGTGKEWRSAQHGPRYRTCIECGGSGQSGGRSKGDH